MKTVENQRQNRRLNATPVRRFGVMDISSTKMASGWWGVTDGDAILAVVVFTVCGFALRCL